MLKDLERGIKMLVELHREHVEVWREQEKEMNRLSTAYTNHIQQRTLFINTDISETSLSQSFPQIKAGMYIVTNVS